MFRKTVRRPLLSCAAVRGTVRPACLSFRRMPDAQRLKRHVQVVGRPLSRENDVRNAVLHPSGRDEPELLAERVGIMVRRQT